MSAAVHSVGVGVVDVGGLVVVVLVVGSSGGVLLDVGPVLVVIGRGLAVVLVLLLAADVDEATSAAAGGVVGSATGSARGSGTGARIAVEPRIVPKGARGAATSTGAVRDV